MRCATAGQYNKEDGVRPATKAVSRRRDGQTYGTGTFSIPPGGTVWQVVHATCSFFQTWGCVGASGATDPSTDGSWQTRQSARGVSAVIPTCCGIAETGFFSRPIRESRTSAPMTAAATRMKIQSVRFSRKARAVYHWLERRAAIDP